MKITRIDNSKPTFGRQLNAKEMEVYTKSLNQGLKLLNKQMDIIIHNSAAPAIKKENTGIGSLFSRTVQEKLIPFLKSHGFTGIQQEPNNLRKLGDPSPYAPESSAKNIFVIPLEKLTTEEYGKLLSEEDFAQVVKNRSKASRVDYYNVSEEYNKVLHTAFENLKKSGALKEEFAQFKKESGNELKKAAIYRILDSNYQKPWKEWIGIDKSLFSTKSTFGIEAAQKRIAEISEKHEDDIEYFLFQQFLIDKANKESNIIAQKTGIKIIGDSPVATPAADEWINQNLFLEGKAIGCPPDYFSKDGQRWGFGYFNPKYIFNPDGTLGQAGRILKEKYDKFFSSFPGGLRIDHVIGLVDPFIYTVKDAKMTPQNSGRIYSMKGEFKKKEEEYSNILEKIVLQSAREHGIDKSNIICEDLGDPNIPTRRVMRELDLSGVSVTQFDYRGKDVPERNVIMIGSHDNISFLEYVNELFKKAEGKDISERNIFKKLITYYKYKFNIGKYDKDLVHFMRKTEMLAEDTAPKDFTKSQLKEYKKQIRSDKKKFIEASFAELFTSPAKRIQIFFADFWGMGKTYNRPGTEKGNWELRIPSEFEDKYYEAVSDGRAPNLAKAVLTALKQRGLDKTNIELADNLYKSAEILSSR